MMTGYEIYESAMLKLGYTAQKGSVENETPFKAIALQAINEIGEGLFLNIKMGELSENVQIPENAVLPLTYGVAMMLSFYASDWEKNSVMTEMFEAKRSGYLSGIKKVIDNSPKIYEV